VLDCKCSSQEKVVKWFARGGIADRYNGDVPNGYAWWACTPLRQWCDQILILVIPILVIHPDRDRDFSNPS
jgi:hypothetical protein